MKDLKMLIIAYLIQNIRLLTVSIFLVFHFGLQVLLIVVQ